MQKKTFKQSKTNDKFRGIFPFEFDDKGKSSDPEIPGKIHLIPIGQWEHDLYGPIIINNADIREFIQNFNAGIRKGVFITAGHEGFQELPAVGWVTEVESRDDGLWGTVAWNSEGVELLKERAFKFFSPEMCRDYEDPEDHQYYRNVLTGGALTKSPYFKELQQIVFSDKNITSSNLKKQTMSKTLDEVLAIANVAELTDEDKAVLKENADKLTDEQKVTYASALEEKKAETEEEKTAREAKEKEDAEKAEAEKKAAEDAAAAEEAKKQAEIQASEKTMVKISASELAILREKADKGVQAFKELEKNEIDGYVSRLTFTESNKTGKFLPKSKDNLRAFIEKLDKDMRVSFVGLVSQLQVNEKFEEKGVNDAATDGTARAEVDSKVDAKLKANPKMTYSEALKQVMSENKGLEERYDQELPSAKK